LGVTVSALNELNGDDGKKAILVGAKEQNTSLLMSSEVAGSQTTFGGKETSVWSIL
jgi:hypothetical protein